MGRSDMGAATRLLNAVPAPIAGRFATHSWAARLARPFVNAVVPRGIHLATVRSGPAKGLVLAIDPRTEKYYWTGTYERAVQDALVRLLRPGAVFWDVGAHVGFFSLLAARLVGGAGRVHAFEPVPANAGRLRRNLERSGFANVAVHRLALAEAPGEVFLAPHDASSMWRVATEGEASIRVAAGTLDELAARLGPPAAVKIDVEGSELDVLRGGAGLIAHARPVFVVEQFGASTDAEALAMLPGYRAIRLDDHNWLFEPSV